MEKKLTDEEIVKALRVCATDEIAEVRCPNCILEEENGCCTVLLLNALDLIQRLQDDYSKLKERYVKVLDLNEKVIAKQNAEIERLKGFIDFKTANVMCDKCKEQAVKDTAKKILQELFDEATSNVSETVELTTFQIEQLAKRYGVEVE